MARQNANRFKVNPGTPTGASPEELAAYTKWFEEEKKAFIDLQAGLISADEAMKEVKDAAEKYARAAGVDGKTKGIREQTNESSINELAKDMGIAGIANAQQQAMKKWDEAASKVMEDLNKNLLTADQARQEIKGIADKYARESGVDLKDKKQREEDAVKKINQTAKNNGVDGTTETSTESGMASMLDQLGPGLGKNAYKGARAMRYIDTIKKADFGKLTGDLGKAFGGAGKAAAGAGATGAGAGAAGAASGAAAGAAGAAGGTAAASGAAGAAAAGGQLAAAAGPIGAVVALADMAAGEIAGKFNKFGRNIERAGDVAVKIAGNDGMGAVASAAESVAGGLEEIPIVGQVWAAEIRLATTALTTFNKVLGAFATRGKELSGYAGGVSQATAMAEVRGQLHDIKEAQSLDSDYKSIIQSQSRIQTNIQDALTPIKLLIMRLLEPMAANLEMATKLLALAGDGAMILSKQQDEADRKIFEAVKSIPAIAKLFEKIYEIAKQFDGAEGEALPLNELLLLANRIQLPNQPVDPAANAAATAIGFPLLK